MIQVAEENNVILMIGHNQRLMPPHVKAKEILESGSLGNVLTFAPHFHMVVRNRGRLMESTVGFSEKKKPLSVRWEI